MSDCIYHEAHPPSGVTHSVAAHFTHVAKPPHKKRGSAPNLVLAKKTVLEVYDVRRAADTAHLELLGSFKLYGVVEDLAVLRSKSPSTQRDAIVLTFRDAKVCVLDWDCANLTVRNTSLHYYEADPTLRKGRTVFPYPPRVVTDPQGRCAAACIYDNQLALLPAMSTDVLEVDDVLDLGEEEGGAVQAGDGSSTTVGNSFVLDLAKMGIKEVRDLVFLNGYTEPVLLILHEELPTWAGRYRDRKDTCCLTALSISLHRKRHPIIWSFKNLPSDSFKAVAVPKGGALVLTQNLVLYYTQGFSSGLAVNRFAHAGEVPSRVDFQASSEPLAAIISQHARAYAVNIHPECAPAAGRTAPRAPDLEVDLTGAHCVWLQPDLCLMGLKTGQLVQLQLHFMANVVSRMQAAFVMMAPYCSCLTKLASDLLFLASWTGDSMLVRYEREHAIKEEGDAEQQNVKRRRLDSGQLDEDGDDDDDEMLFFSHSRTLPSLSKDKSDEVRFTLRVLDSLACVSPVHDMILLDPSAHAPADQVNTPSKVVARLVSCVGKGRTGALAVMGVSVVPEVLERAPLENIQGLWALHWSESGDILYNKTAGEKGHHPYHTYLLITAEGSTVVMSSGEELDEITDSTEYSTAATVAAGSLYGGAVVCQVVVDAVLMLRGTVKVHEFKLRDAWKELGDPPEDVCIVDANICHSYVLLKLSNKQAVLLQATVPSFMLKVVLQSQPSLMTQPTTNPEDAIAACTLYVDRTAWLATTTAPPETVGVPGLGEFATMSRSEPAAPNSVYCVLCRESGRIEICSLPDMQLVFYHEDIQSGLRVLTNKGKRHMKSGRAERAAQQGEQNGREDTGDGEGGKGRIVEIRLETFDDMQDVIGHSKAYLPGTAPFLVMLTSDGHLMAYQAFQPELNAVSFVRKHLLWPGPGVPEAGDQPVRRKLIRFDHVGGAPYMCQGLFLLGDSPAMLSVHRSRVHPHPLPADGPITAMTPFHNSNCPFGFVVGTQKGFMEICSLPHDLMMGQPWPVRKIGLRATPHRIAQHPKTGSLLLLVSKLLPYQPRNPTEIGGDQHAAAAYVAADVAAKTAGREEVFELRVMNPHTYELQAVAQLHRNEVALAVKALNLKNSKTEAQQLVIAVGTGTCLGEDYPCTGRIVFYDLVEEKADNDPKEETVKAEDEADAEPAPPAKVTYKLQELYTKEFPGPLTVVAEFHGYLMVATGYRLELHAWNGTSLVKSAFFDGPMLISSINTIKDFLLLGDIHNSVVFLRYKEAGRQLQQLGKDFDRCDVAATELMFNSGKLSFVVADSAGTLRVIAFDQEDPLSWKGKKLLLRGAFHTGNVAPRMLRVRMISEDNLNRQATFFGTTAGSFSILLPSWDSAMYQRLAALQKLLVYGLPHAAGLNPKAFRNRHAKIPKGMHGGELYMRPKDTGCILDGTLVLEYLQLDRAHQQQWASELETSREQLLKDCVSLSSALMPIL